MGAESAQADPVGGADDCAAKPAREEVALMSSDPTDAGAVAMARRGIFLCKPGQPIAHRVDVPADSPRNPGQAILSELRLGKNVIWDPKQAAYVSYVAGHATLRQGKLDAEEVLELSDDVDGIDGAVTYDGQLIVRRNVLDLAMLKAAGSITVHGSIEAATVHTDSDLHVYHGICGKEKGRSSAKGRITTRFVTNAHVTSGGDMLVANEIVNSNLICAGALKVEHGTIVGGHTVARGGIVCHTAGSEAGVRTTLEIGLSQERYFAIQQSWSQAELTRRKARDIRDAVGPLMARSKSLTAAQKEKATELLFAADEAEAQAVTELAALEHEMADLRSAMDAKIVVNSILHAGVLVRFPVAAALISAPMRGPLEITLRCTGGETQIVVIDRCRNTCIPLPSLSGSEGIADMARKFLTGCSPARSSREVAENGA